jgi:hypothetical protein
MAPEYFTTGNSTPASDVWSLGVMLLEALTGSHPFGKTTLGVSNEQIIANILNKDISAATANLTEPLKKIITDCLRREVVLRTESAQVFKAELQNTTNDTFTERTQVINHDRSKSPIKKTNTSLNVFICKIKELLFDFRLSNGLWEKTLAKEVVLFFLTIALLIIYWKFRKVGISSDGVFLSDYITHFLDLGDFEVREDIYIVRNPVAYAFWFFVFRWLVSRLLAGLKQVGISVVSIFKSPYVKYPSVLIIILVIGFKVQQYVVLRNMSVTIGNQVWMKQNLNVDEFRNGDPIPEAKSAEEWRNAYEYNQPAWCYYNNDPSNGSKYGKIYNYYAVSDTRGLAPKGWRIPRLEEWEELTNFLLA